MYTVTFVLYILILSFQCNFCKLLAEQSKTELDMLVQCAVEGQTKNLPENQIILIPLLLNSEYLDGTEMLLKTIGRLKKWAVTLVDITMTVILKYFDDYSSRTQNYIIYCKGSAEFLQIIEGLERLEVFNARAKFLLLFSSTVNQNQEALFSVFETLQKYEMYKVVLLIPDSSDVKSVNIFKSVPFKNGTCSLNQVSLISVCRNGVLKTGSPWYLQQIPKTFSSCKIKVVCTHYLPYIIHMEQNYLKPEKFLMHGLDIALLANMLFQKNITIQFLLSNISGEVYTDKSSTGAVGKIYKRKAHIAIAGYAQTFTRMRFLDCSFRYNTESLVWVVPQEHLPFMDTVGLISIIKFNVWLLLVLLVTVTTSIILLLTKRTKLELDDFQKLVATFVTVLLASLNFYTHLLPRTPEVRVVFSVTLMFALIFNAAFTTYLTSVLAREVTTTEKYQTVNDIKKYNLSIIRAPNSERAFANNQTTDYELFQKAQVCEIGFHNNCFDQVTLKKNTAFLVEKGAADYVKVEYLKQEILSFHLNLLMVKGFWGYDMINDLISYSVDSGLATKWMNSALDFNRKERPFIERKSRSKRKLMGFKDLRLVFVFVVLGYFTGFCVFVIEVLMLKWKPKRL